MYSIAKIIWQMLLFHYIDYWCMKSDDQSYIVVFCCFYFYLFIYFFHPCVQGMNQAWAQSKSQAGINKELFCPSQIWDRRHQSGATLPRSGTSVVFNIAVSIIMINKRYWFSNMGNTFFRGASFQCLGGLNENGCDDY